jgi:hypothetical protein
MKKVIYLLIGLSLFFTACNPLEDIYEEIPSTNEVLTGNLKYTLTDEDYTKEIDKGGHLELRFSNFSSDTEAKELIPAFLIGEYPFWGEGSIAEITYKLYAKKNDEKSLEIYKVSSQDYADGGHTYGNFSKDYHITDFLNIKYPSPADRLLVSLTYKYYDGSVSTLNNGFLFNNGTWEMIQGFTNDEYNQMGESYPNFSSEDEAYTKTPLFLLDKFKFANKKAGDIEAVMYKLYVGGGVTEGYVAYFVYDGANWSKYENTINKALKLGFIEGKWVPDNTIKYTLTNADYDFVGNGRYNNFDVRTGKDEFEESARLAKINTILLNNFPADAEEQKYVISYKVYSGVNEVWEMKVIKTGGVYVLQ